MTELFNTLLGNIALLLCNIVHCIYNLRLKTERNSQLWFKKTNRFTNTQIGLDLLILAYLIHFSGGLENPFIFYFIFHMVIASILLSNRAAYLQASITVFLLGMMITLERTQVFPHYHVDGFIDAELYNYPHFVFGLFTAFITTLYLTVYMATSIVNKLREREEQLAKANERLAEQDRLKSQYVLTVSHDLQTSLATIQNCLKVVLSDLTGPISEKAREMISRAEQRTLYLLHFIRDLLDLSRIKAMKDLEKRDLSFSQVVKKVIDQVKPRIEGKKISLELSIPENCSPVHANKDALEGLFINLVVNAIKYTPWSGKVGIRIVEVKPECFHTMVWDTGIGIPQDELHKIFDEFYRAKNAEQMKKEGTGLGLSIVKEILKAHHGDIWVESEVGKGSKFVFTLSNGGNCGNCPDKWKI